MFEERTTFERVGDYMSVKASEEHLQDIRARLKRGFSLAFLVTNNFEIIIGKTNMHKDIGIPDSSIVDKGRLIGKTSRISYDVSDSSKRSEIDPKELAYLHAAIREKLNDALDMDTYFQDSALSN